MTYDVSASGNDTLRFDDGSNLLVSGPSMESKEVLYDVIAEGLRDDQSAIVIATDQGAGAVVRALENRVELVPDRLGVIDATGEAGESVDVSNARVRTLGSAGDLTGLSLEFAKLLQGLEDVGNADEVRVGVATVSTLLMYTDVRTVFRFLHVFTSRIRSAELFGTFALDPGMHEDQTTNTVRAIFDAEARVSGDDTEVRGSGFSRV